MRQDKPKGRKNGNKENCEKIFRGAGVAFSSRKTQRGQSEGGEREKTLEGSSKLEGKVNRRRRNGKEEKGKSGFASDHVSCETSERKSVRRRDPAREKKR